MNLENIKPEHFKLQKVSFLKESIKVSYTIERNNPDAIYIDRYSVECIEPGRPQLYKALEKFKLPVAMAANALIGSNTLMNNKLIIDTKIKDKQQKELKKKIEDQIFDEIDIKGIIYVTDDDEPVIKIIGGINSSLGFSLIGIPNIKVSKELIHGFEPQLEEGLKAVDKEIYNYVIKMERAQLTMFNEEEEEKEVA